jgi:glutamine phosphoribosylpyrophosphate amidotransferase
MARNYSQSVVAVDDDWTALVGASVGRNTLLIANHGADTVYIAIGTPPSTAVEAYPLAIGAKLELINAAPDAAVWARCASTDTASVSVLAE